MNDFYAIQLNGWRRALLIAPVLALLIISYISFTWYIGNTLAETAPNPDIARLAQGLSPGDPQTNLTLALQLRNSLEADGLPMALKYLANAVALSPNDFRLWVELGRTYEQNGDAEGGEKAYAEAVRLAPSYADPHWFLGNLLVRNYRYDEGFAELKRAAQANPDLLQQSFSLALHIYGDFNVVIDKLGNNATTKARLVQYFTAAHRYDDAVKVWNLLSDDERKKEEDAGRLLLHSLYDKGRFRQALDVYRQLNDRSSVNFTPERISNGSFENQITEKNHETYFGWLVGNPVQPEIRIDGRTGRTGKRSLYMLFDSPMGGENIDVRQVLVVQPSTAYRLEFYAKPGDLRGASTPVVQVGERTTGPNGEEIFNVLGKSEPLPNGKEDWKQYSLEFTTGAAMEAVYIKFDRSECITGVCPIFGKAWYDDFDLKRIGDAGRP